MNQDKWAVITGSTKGIGAAVARKHLKLGYKVVVNYSSDDDSASKFMESLEDDEREKVSFIKQSLDTFENVQLFCDKLLDKTSEIERVILNCATTETTQFLNTKPQDWERVIAVNLSCPFYLIQRLAPVLSKDLGRVVFIGSIMGEYPHARSIAYGVSKAAVHFLAKSLVKEMVELGGGITVNAISPGFTDTSWQPKKNPDHRKRIESKIACGRFAYAEEIAQCVVMTCENPYINGSVIDVNGGYCYR